MDCIGLDNFAFWNALMIHNIFKSPKPTQLEEEVGPFCLGWKKQKGWKKDSQKKWKIQNYPNIKKNVKVQKLPSFKK